MSQNSQDWSGWITAITGIVTVVGGAVAWLMLRIFSTVTRKEFQDYLEKRDQLSEDRHNQNLDNFKELFKVGSDTRERVARLEGEITGRHRQT